MTIPYRVHDSDVKQNKLQGIIKLTVIFTVAFFKTKNGNDIGTK
jgi:hypothetical protein